MYEGNSEDESRKILIDGRDAETRGKRDAPTREIEGTRGTRVRAASLGKGKKSRRRMDYRGASKDGTMEAKTETSLTGSRLPGRESTWPTGALELPGSSVSTCLPLPSILLSLFLSFSRFLLLFLPSRLLLSISSSSSFSFSFSSSPLSLLTPSREFAHLGGGPPRRSCYYLYPWPVPHRYARRVVSRKFAENAFFMESVEAARRCRTCFPVKTVTRRLTGRRGNIVRGYRLL